MAYNINPVNYEEYVTRRLLLKISYSCLSALEKRVMDIVRILYTNPSKCFNRKNGKNYTYNEALEMLDKKKFDKLKRDDITDKEIIEILVSKTIGLIFE